MFDSNYSLTIVHHNGKQIWDELLANGRPIEVPFRPRGRGEPVARAIDWLPFGANGPPVRVVFTFFPRIVHLYPDETIRVEVVEGSTAEIGNPWWFRHRIDDLPEACNDAPLPVLHCEPMPMFDLVS